MVATPTLSSTSQNTGSPSSSSRASRSKSEWMNLREEQKVIERYELRQAKVKEIYQQNRNKTARRTMKKSRMICSRLHVLHAPKTLPSKNHSRSSHLRTGAVIVTSSSSCASSRGRQKRSNCPRSRDGSFSRAMRQLCSLMARLSLVDHAEPRRRLRKRLARRRVVSIHRKTKFAIKRSGVDALVDDELVGMLSHMSLASPKLDAIESPFAREVAEEAPTEDVDDGCWRENASLHAAETLQDVVEDDSRLQVLTPWAGSGKPNHYESYDEGDVSLLSSCSSSSVDTDDEADLSSLSRNSALLSAKELLSPLLRIGLPFTSIVARIGSVGIRSNGTGPSPTISSMLIHTSSSLAFVQNPPMPDICDVD